jgi:hypothetical protein
LIPEVEADFCRAELAQGFPRNEKAAGDLHRMAACYHPEN